jgi:glycosyltransferase involved in cell wall biosynthesis
MNLRQHDARNPAPSSRRRIMQVLGTASGGFGGLEKHFFDLCNGLAKDFEVIAVGHPDQAQGLGPDITFESLGRDTGRRNPFTLLRLARIIRRWQPDVIHAHANRAASMVGSIRFVSRARRVATVHGMKTSYRPYRSFHQVIAVSQGVAAPIPHPHVSVVYNGIAPPQLPRGLGRDYLQSQFPDLNHKPVAVAIGRLAHVKGYDILIDAWRAIDAQLLIVGDGPERSALQQQIIGAGLQQQVRLVGFRKDILPLLASADCSVMSSRREGFSYALVEALAARALVISTNVSGANELLPAEFLAPCADAPALRACLRRHLSNLPAARQAFAPVWEHAAEQLTVAAMIRNTAALYFPETQPISRAA